MKTLGYEYGYRYCCDKVKVFPVRRLEVARINDYDGDAVLGADRDNCEIDSLEARAHAFSNYNIPILYHSAQGLCYINIL